MPTEIWYFSLRVSKCFFLMVDLKSFTVHNGRRMNYLRPSGLNDGLGREFSINYVLSFESPSDPSTSQSSSSSVEGELVDGTLSS